jgi:NitT/TauT family transport system permease protein
MAMQDAALRPGAPVLPKPVRSAAVRALRTLPAMLLLAAGWELASRLSQPFLFPGLASIAGNIVDILATPHLRDEVLVTWWRILLGVGLSLVIGVPLGLLMASSRLFDDLLRGTVKLVMGVPALSWVIIVAIWFSQVELRIAFVLLMLCAPVTVFCVYDAVRAIDPKMPEMARAFGAGPLQRMRLVVWPWVTASAFTAAKINAGNAARTVIVAELVGAPLGIGKELDLAKNVFDMSLVLAWTLVMVGLSGIMMQGIEQLERLVLRWARARGETR